MIDWHCHILPGLDDGATDMLQSLAMAAALTTAGFGTVYCTPHRMRGCYEADNMQVRQGVVDLQERLEANNIPLTLLSGCEYCLDEYLLPSLLQDPLPLGASRNILVEIPPQLSVEMVRQVLYGVVRSGFTPVIAHPERCLLLEPVVRCPEDRSPLTTFTNLLRGRLPSRDEGEARLEMTAPPLLDYLRDLGCAFQGNLGSFKGLYGRRVQKTAQGLRELGIYDRYGSDLHRVEQAPLIFDIESPRSWPS